MDSDFYARRRRSDAVREEPQNTNYNDNDADVQVGVLDSNVWRGNGVTKLPSINAYYDDEINEDGNNVNGSDDSGYDDGSQSGDGAGSDGGQEPKDNRFKRWWANLITSIKAHPKRSAIIIVAVLLVLGGGTTFAIMATHKKPVQKAATVAPKKKAAPAPQVITSPLTGMPVSADQSKRIVTGAMIENTPYARPQSGLKDAGVVFEAIAEAGITRFLALYQEAVPANMGPIRSARPYYVDWAHSFDAPLAHVGGSPDALAKIKNDGVKDLDQFYNSGAYHRIGTRDAPHNMYTNMDALNQLESSKGWTGSTFTGFGRKKEAPSKAPNAKSINIAISGPTYDAHYDYDPAANSYKRSEGGAPHIDAESNTQLEPKVVIGLVAPYSLMSDGYHSEYQITGSGQMTVFQDGIATKGTWNKKDSTSQYTFTDEGGHALKLNPGQTWITVVGDASAVTYTP